MVVYRERDGPPRTGAGNGPADDQAKARCLAILRCSWTMP
jgi:hypothetical protein